MNKNLYISIGINLLLVCIIGWILMIQYATKHESISVVNQQALNAIQSEYAIISAREDSLMGLLLNQEEIIAQNALKYETNNETKTRRYETIEKIDSTHYSDSVRVALQRFISAAKQRRIESDSANGSRLDSLPSATDAQ